LALLRGIWGTWRSYPSVLSGNSVNPSANLAGGFFFAIISVRGLTLTVNTWSGGGGYS